MDFLRFDEFIYHFSLLLQFKLLLQSFFAYCFTFAGAGSGFYNTFDDVNVTVVKYFPSPTCSSKQPSDFRSWTLYNQYGTAKDITLQIDEQAAQTELRFIFNATRRN